MCSDATTTGYPHLPTELWSEILENINAGSNTLHNVSLTRRRFHSPAQPLLFRDIYLANCFDEHHLSRHSARLDFFSSDAIAPFVHVVNISGDVFVEPEYTILLEKVLGALPRFINLRSFSCHGVDFHAFRPAHQVSTRSSLEH
jgi:hypothetical protein